MASIDGVIPRSSAVGLAPAGDGTPKPKDAGDAARQFEALLLGQMLRTAHTSEESEDSTGDTMWDMAAQQFAQVMADNGGMGLAKLIVKGLGTTPSTPGHPRVPCWSQIESS
ncbi:MAG: rod-binding protein [Acidobacteriota bacterium]